MDLDWLPGGRLNMAHEAIDRHANGRRRDKLALIWDGRDGEHEEYTFGAMKTLTNRFANVLKSLGIERGDRVCLYLDRLPELYVAFFGILKVGAIIVPLSQEIEAEPLKEKLSDSAAKVVVTQPELRRRMAAIIYELFDLQHIVVINKNDRDPVPIDTADLNYDEEMAKAPVEFDIVPANQYDHSVMHYVGDAGGRPRGMVYSHEAVAQHHAVGRWVLDLRDDDVYWYTSDLATVQGTACGILAPWAGGATVFTAEGKVDPEACYEKVQSRRVTVLCAGTAAAEQILQGGDDAPRHFDLSSLRHLVSVGAPLSAESDQVERESPGEALPRLLVRARDRGRSTGHPPGRGRETRLQRPAAPRRRRRGPGRRIRSGARRRRRHSCPASGLARHVPRLLERHRAVQHPLPQRLVYYGPTSQDRQRRLRLAHSE